MPSIEEEQAAEFQLSDKMKFAIRQPGGIPPSFGITFSVGDARAAAAKFRSRGALIDDPFEWPDCVMAFGRAPDGNGFMLHQRTVKKDRVSPRHVRAAR